MNGVGGLVCPGAPDFCDNGVHMSCEERAGSLLAVLVAARPGSRIPELGTGVGEGAWPLSEMTAPPVVTQVTDLVR